MEEFLNKSGGLQQICLVPFVTVGLFVCILSGMKLIITSNLIYVSAMALLTGKGEIRCQCYMLQIFLIATQEYRNMGN